MEWKTTGVYFSPTGGTRRALEVLCGSFGPAELLELGAGQRWERQMGREELLILALPVYAGQIPAVPGLLDGLNLDSETLLIIGLLFLLYNEHADNVLLLALAYLLL